MDTTAQETPVQQPERAGSPGPVSLWTLFTAFLKIGSTAFGGFMSMISVVQNYAVDRKQWIKQEDMLDGISLATILPGPMSFKVIVFVGYKVRGWIGALVTGFAVMLPSFILLIALTSAYYTYGHLPAVGSFFKGFRPAVTAIILAAVWSMSKKTVKGMPEGLLAVAAFILLLVVRGFFITAGIVAAGGIAGWLLFRRSPTTSAAPAESAQKTGAKTAKKSDDTPGTKPSAHAAVAATMGGAAPLLSLNIAMAFKLFTVFAGMSVLLFGGSYVFIPVMQRIIVDGYGWVTRQEFIDAVALGQVTPGPNLISAAFIGFKVAGLLGAAAATAGIFTPPAIIMLACYHYLDRIKKSAMIKAALHGVHSCVIGMVAAAGVVVARTAEPNAASLLIFGAALLALLRYKVDVVWVIPIAGVVGLVLY